MTLESNIAVEGDAGAAPRGYRLSLRLNNIAELRLLFASFVVLSHSVQLAGASHLDVIRIIMNSEVAVQGFFILSGYLVFGSYDRIRDARTFYQRRFLRIYPAYLVAVLFFLTLGVVQALVIGQGVRWMDLGPYLAANLTTLNFLYPTVGGVFSGNSLNVINGALWSIKVELMFYALVPFLYAFAVRYPIGLLAGLLIAGGAIWWPALLLLGDALGTAVPLSFKYQVPGQLHFFGLGIALFAHSKGRISTAALGGLTAFAVLFLLILGLTREALHALGLVTVIGAISSLPKMKDFFGRNDISYGVYLSHFPTIQLLLAAGAGQWPFLWFIATVVSLAGLYGYLSWQFIERPALSWSRKARQ